MPQGVGVRVLRPHDCRVGSRLPGTTGPPQNRRHGALADLCSGSVVAGADGCLGEAHFDAVRRVCTRGRLRARTGAGGRSLICSGSRRSSCASCGCRAAPTGSSSRSRTRGTSGPDVMLSANASGYLIAFAGVRERLILGGYDGSLRPLADCPPAPDAAPLRLAAGTTGFAVAEGRCGLPQIATVAPDGTVTPVAPATPPPGDAAAPYGAGDGSEAVIGLAYAEPSIAVATPGFARVVDVTTGVERRVPRGLIGIEVALGGASRRHAGVRQQRVLGGARRAVRVAAGRGRAGADRRPGRRRGGRDRGWQTGLRGGRRGSGRRARRWALAGAQHVRTGTRRSPGVRRRAGDVPQLFVPRRYAGHRGRRHGDAGAGVGHRLSGAVRAALGSLRAVRDGAVDRAVPNGCRDTLTIIQRATRRHPCTGERRQDEDLCPASPPRSSICRPRGTPVP